MPVGHGLEHFVDVPVVVALVFQQLDPEIRQAHSKPVIEAKSAILNRIAKTRHSAYLLGDTDRIWIDFVNECIGQLQIGDSIEFHTIRKILERTTEINAISMMEIDHGSYTVEAIAIEVVFLEPVTHI